jgi:hypothetical protein
MPPISISLSLSSIKNMEERRFEERVRAPVQNL